MFEEKCNKFIKDYWMVFAFGIIVGVLVYLPMMANNLTNDLDGIWHPSNFVAGDWEISLGRGLQRYADRARFGLVTSSYNTILAVALMSMSNCLILKRFEVQNNILKALFCVLTIANPVMCESLSYSYLCVNFLLAGFFSVMGFFVLSKKADHIKKQILFTVAAGIILAVSMSFYQAYIGVAYVLMILFMMKQISKKQDSKSILYMIYQTIGSLVICGVFYLCITKLLLFRAEIELAEYKGAEEISIGYIIQSLPNTVISSYTQFSDYFIGGKYNVRLEFAEIVFKLLLVLIIVSFIYKTVKIWNYNKINAIINILLFILIPIAISLVCIIAVGNVMTGLMSMSFIIFIAGYLLYMSEIKWERYVFVIATIIVCWFYTGAVENDQIAMLEGRTSTVTITQSIISEILDEGLLEQSDCVAFVGRMANNPLFVKSQAYNMANEYAMFGSWSTDTRNNRVTWFGIISNLCGIALNQCDDTTYDKMKAEGIFDNMEVYPTKNSIKIVNGVLVIKVSDLY